MKYLKHLRPNGFDIALCEEDGWYWVCESLDDYDTMDTEFENLEEATVYFDERVKELAETPNWEAQARYDEEHGTDNGYAVWQR